MTIENGGYAIPPALQDVYDTLDQLKAMEQPIICHPDDQAMLTEITRQLPWAGLHPVKTSTLIPPGTAIMINRDPLDDSKQRPPDIGDRFYPTDKITPLG